METQVNVIDGTKVKKNRLKWIIGVIGVLVAIIVIFLLVMTYRCNKVKSYYEKLEFGTCTDMGDRWFCHDIKSSDNVSANFDIPKFPYINSFDSSGIYSSAIIEGYEGTVDVCVTIFTNLLLFNKCQVQITYGDKDTIYAVNTDMELKSGEYTDEEIDIFNKCKDIIKMCTDEIDSIV